LFTQGENYLQWAFSSLFDRSRKRGNARLGLPRAETDRRDLSIPPEQKRGAGAEEGCRSRRGMPEQKRDAGAEEGAD